MKKDISWIMNLGFAAVWDLSAFIESVILVESRKWDIGLS